ncbi:MAG: DUF1294 domain-containing protein [Ruminococcus sp.]|nr:DUF1294 domain-containing protein [Ruminococcus sp.]
MLKWILIYVLIMSVIAFAAMGLDKRRARKGQWRIPEKMLFLFVILGGGAGGLAGMYLFRHKTKHWYFAIGFPVIFVLELVGVIALYIFTDGFAFF